MQKPLFSITGIAIYQYIIILNGLHLFKKNPVAFSVDSYLFLQISLLAGCCFLHFDSLPRNR